MRLIPVLVAALLLSACRNPFEDEKGGTTDSGDAAATDDDGDGYGPSDDCNDADASVNPGGVEVCDGVDNNCDGQVDEGVSDVWYADADGDGFGDLDAVTEACAAPVDHVDTATDCDDSDANAYPGNPEVCDDVDNDCDGDVDEGVADSWYADADSDGYGDADVVELACAAPAGFVSVAEDCDDSTAAAYPGADEICDELDNDCDGDVDEDVTRAFYGDGDADGYGDAAVVDYACAAPEGYVDDPSDCDDGVAAVNPGATELCNSVDDDCDGDVDEDDAADAGTWYLDADSDAFGDASVSASACSQPSGYVADGTDCDDSTGAVNPSAVEVCNAGVDDDCDGLADDADSSLDTSTTRAWYGDGDADGYGDPGVTAASCAAPSGYVDNGDDCDDGESAVSPAGVESCNAVDDDCDGTVDEDDAVDASTWYADADADGYGDVSLTADACQAPSGYVSDATDCDDAVGSVNPGATELCNSLDDDCDGTIDEDDAADATTWYADTDADGFGDASTADISCSAPSGYVDDGTDCDDADAVSYPGAEELCDAVDNDCDGAADAGVSGADEVCAVDSCKVVLDDGGSTGDGTYWLAGSSGTFRAHCDMTRDGGGWTLIGSLVNDLVRGWDSYAVWSGVAPFGSIATRQSADFKGDAYGETAGDDFMVATDEYDFAFYSLVGGLDFATFVDSEYDATSCSTTFLASGADWSDKLDAGQAALQTFVVQGLDDNAGTCFPNGNENAAIVMQLSSCCWANGLGNTPNGYPGWELYDLSLLKLSYLTGQACTAGAYPCNDAGYLNGGSNGYTYTSKVAWAELYVR